MMSCRLAEVRNNNSTYVWLTMLQSADSSDMHAYPNNEQSLYSLANGEAEESERVADMIKTHVTIKNMESAMIVHTLDFYKEHVKPSCDQASRAIIELGEQVDKDSQYISFVSNVVYRFHALISGITDVKSSGQQQHMDACVRLHAYLRLVTQTSPAVEDLNSENGLFMVEYDFQRLLNSGGREMVSSGGGGGGELNFLKKIFDDINKYKRDVLEKHIDLVTTWYREWISPDKHIRGWSVQDLTNFSNIFDDKSLSRKIDNDTIMHLDLLRGTEVDDTSLFKLLKYTQVYERLDRMSHARLVHSASGKRGGVQVATDAGVFKMWHWSRHLASCNQHFDLWAKGCIGTMHKSHFGHQLSLESFRFDFKMWH